MKLSLLLLPSLLLVSGCSLNPIPTTGALVANNALCDDKRTAEPNDGILQIITYDSELDTPETIAQVRENNAVRDELCGPLQGD